MNGNYRTLLAGAFVAVLAIGPAADGAAAEWGSIKGKLIYEGKPEVKPVNLTADAAYCSEHKPMEELIVVGKEGALQNVFVYLAVARNKKVDIHPDYKAEDLKPAILDNKGCRFEPHAQTLWTAQPLEIRNSDPLAHNTNGTKLLFNTDFNETIAKDRPLVKKFDKSEPIPTEITCNVHPWMNAVVLIRDNPYMAVSGEDGSFEIKNVPAGKQEFVFWHQAQGNLRDLEVGEETADRKGQVKVEVPAGETIDLGEIKVAPDILGQKG